MIGINGTNMNGMIAGGIPSCSLLLINMVKITAVVNDKVNISRNNVGFFIINKIISRVLASTMGNGESEVRFVLLEKWVQFRTTDRTTELDYPEYTAKEVRRFLAD